MNNLLLYENHSDYEINPNLINLPNITYCQYERHLHIDNKINNKIIVDMPAERTNTPSATNSEYMAYLLGINGPSLQNLFETYGYYGSNTDPILIIRSTTSANWNNYVNSTTHSITCSANQYNNLEVGDIFYVCGSSTDTYQFNLMQIQLTSKSNSGSTYTLNGNIIKTKIFDQNKPPIEYILDFDIKSYNTDIAHTMLLYFYNSNIKVCKTKAAKFGNVNYTTNNTTNFDTLNPITTSYQHYSLSFVPVRSRLSSNYDNWYISAYGTYKVNNEKTYNVPIVKNLTLKVTRNYKEIFL